MFKAKLIMAVFVAALVFGAVLSASASAATAGWVVNGTLLSGTSALAATAETAPSVLEAPEAGITVKCNSKTVSISNGQIISPEKGSVESLTFNGCEDVLPEKCTLEGTSISTVPLLLQEITLDGTLATKGRIKPKTKNTAATFMFLGEQCSLVGQTQVVSSSVGVPFLDPEGQDPRTVFKILSGENWTIGPVILNWHTTTSLQLANHLFWNFT